MRFYSHNPPQYNCNSSSVVYSPITQFQLNTYFRVILGLNVLSACKKPLRPTIPIHAHKHKGEYKLNGYSIPTSCPLQKSVPPHKLSELIRPLPSYWFRLELTDLLIIQLELKNIILKDYLMNKLKQQ